MIAEHFDLGDLRDGKWFRLQPDSQPLVFRIRGINDDIAVEQPHSSRPGNGRSCRISRCHRAGSGMFLMPPRAAMRRRESSVFTLCPASCSVFPGTGIKVAITFTFPRRISAGTGSEGCRPRAAQEWQLSCSLFEVIAEFGPIRKNKGPAPSGLAKRSVDDFLSHGDPIPVPVFYVLAIYQDAFRAEKRVIEIRTAEPLSPIFFTISDRKWQLWQQRPHDLMLLGKSSRKRITALFSQKRT
jgi:hypothetical protein